MSIWQGIKSFFVVEETPKKKPLPLRPPPPPPQPPCKFGAIDTTTGEFREGYVERGEMKYRDIPVPTYHTHSL